MTRKKINAEEIEKLVQRAYDLMAAAKGQTNAFNMFYEAKNILQKAMSLDLRNEETVLHWAYCHMACGIEYIEQGKPGGMADVGTAESIYKELNKKKRGRMDFLIAACYALYVRGGFLQDYDECRAHLTAAREKGFLPPPHEVLAHPAFAHIRDEDWLRDIFKPQLVT